MKKRDLIITFLGMFLITFISIILVSFLDAKDYGTHIVIFDITTIFMWSGFMIVKNLRNGRN